MENEHLMDSFYGQPFNFSYSSLSRLLWSPKSFKDVYIDGNREEIVADHLIKGKLIHNLILEPDTLQKNYIVMPTDLPTAKTKTVIDRVYAHKEQLVDDSREELEDFGGAILDVMKDMGYFQNLKTDQQRIEKIVTLDNLVYWSFLKMKKGKDLIDQETLTFCTQAVETIKSHPEVCELLGLHLDSMSGNIETINEKMFFIHNYKDYPFGLKGIIDNLKIDHDQKKIFINDLKTTSKDLINFDGSIEHYSYWMQAAMYYELVSVNFKDLLDNGYTIEFNFVAIDRNYCTYAFGVSDSSLNTWRERLGETLDKAEWHYKERNYYLPYELASKKVYL
jgi:hypothetical protein